MTRTPAGCICAAFAALWLGPAGSGSADAQTGGAINLGARGGIAGSAPTHAAPTQERPDSPLEFSFRAGLASDYIYRGTTLSARNRPSARRSKPLSASIYGGGTVASVKLPTQPAAEIAMSGGIRPKLGDVQFDFGATYYFYPGEIAPVDGSAGIDYWEALRARRHQVRRAAAGRRRLRLFAERLQYRRLEQVCGLRPGPRPAEQAAAARRQRVGHRRRRLLLVRQSVARRSAAFRCPPISTGTRA